MLTQRDIGRPQLTTTVQATTLLAPLFYWCASMTLENPYRVNMVGSLKAGGLEKDKVPA